MFHYVCVIFRYESPTPMQYNTLGPKMCTKTKYTTVNHVMSDPSQDIIIVGTYMASKMHTSREIRIFPPHPILRQNILWHNCLQITLKFHFLNCIHQIWDFFIHSLCFPQIEVQVHMWIGKALSTYTATIP